jgi:hypothetical protein
VGRLDWTGESAIVEAIGSPGEVKRL